MTPSHDPQDVTDNTAVGEPLLDPPIVLDPPVVPAESTVPEAVVVANTAETQSLPTPADNSALTGDSDDADSDHGSGGKLKAAALLAGAAAVVSKVRQTAPKKVQELREKRVAGRFVVVTEVNGLPVAVGPYRDVVAASDSAQKMPGGKAIRLMSEDSFLHTNWHHNEA